MISPKEMKKMMEKTEEIIQDVKNRSDGEIAVATLYTLWLIQEKLQEIEIRLRSFRSI